MQSLSWQTALGVTLLMQTVAAFLGQVLPVLAPLLTSGAGVSPQGIGYLSALTSFGTVLFLAFGGPLLARLGPVRSLQLGTGLAALSLLLATSGLWAGLLACALLLGVGYGPTPPAGSRILAATAPPRHRTLIFSLKQAGAPAGGAFAGLAIAPAASAWGWPVALAISLAIGLAACLVIAPLRPRMDVERDPARSVHPRVLFHPNTLALPMRALRSDPLLIPLTGLAVSFAVVQGCLFSFGVTFLATDRGLGLDRAGFAYGCMQLSGVVARIGLGWLADRTGRPAHNLTAQAYGAAVLVVAFAWIPDGASLPVVALICGAVGLLGASWNGIYLAEVARLAPPELIVDATSGSTLFTFLGYVAGPAVFSILVDLIGGWRLPFVLAAGQLAAMAAVQTVLLLRRARSP